MNFPKGATHKWSVSGQFAKRCGGNTWAIWQDEQWLWIGDEFKGSMIHFLAERDAAIADMCEVTGEHITVRSAAALYDAGYRKFEIVEDDV